MSKRKRHHRKPRPDEPCHAEPQIIHSAMKVEPLSQDEVKEALERTALNIVFSQFTFNPLIQAAHNSVESFVILRYEGGKFDGWRLTGASKEVRRAHYGQMIKKFQDAGEGECYTPDGRKVDFE